MTEQLDPLGPAPTRAAALERLHRFLPLAGRHYTAGRNHDTGPGAASAVSGLSPWLRHRVLHEREVLARVTGEHGPGVADKFVQEVFWRTYFKGWLEHHPAAWDRYRDDLGPLREAIRADGKMAERYRSAVSGQTGIVPFDTWVLELRQTGYLHNHARMWFASIWSHTLNLPWQLGAEFFLHHLLDGDPASNTLSWRWVVGLHTPGRIYLARADNIARFAGRRFGTMPDLAAQLTDDAASLEEAPIPETPLDLSSRPVAAGGVGWLFTEEDLTMPGISPPPDACAGVLLGRSAGSPVLAEPVISFKAGALEDALDRASATMRDTDHDRRLDATAEAVVHWARRRNLVQVVMCRPTIGTASAFAASLEAPLFDAGVTLVRRPDPYDAAVWPHARRGYFQLRKRIPELLGRLARHSG